MDNRTQMNYLELGAALLFIWFFFGLSPFVVILFLVAFLVVAFR